MARGEKWNVYDCQLQKIKLTYVAERDNFPYPFHSHDLNINSPD